MQEMVLTATANPQFRSDTVSLEPERTAQARTRGHQIKHSQIDHGAVKSSHRGLRIVSLVWEQLRELSPGPSFAVDPSFLRASEDRNTKSPVSTKLRSSLRLFAPSLPMVRQKLTKTSVSDSNVVKQLCQCAVNMPCFCSGLKEISAGC